MPLIQVVVVLVVVAAILWAAFKYIPMDSDVKTVIKVVVMIAIILWLLQIFGLWGYLNTIRVGK